MATTDDMLRRSTIFRRLAAEDRQRLGAVAAVREFARGEWLFREGDPSDELFTIVAGRVKVSKGTARGTDVILEIFGPGDPVGAVAVMKGEGHPDARGAACIYRSAWGCPGLGTRLVLRIDQPDWNSDE